MQAKVGSPDWIRTSYLVLRKHALYPNELRDHFLTDILARPDQDISPEANGEHV